MIREADNSRLALIPFRIPMTPQNNLDLQGNFLTHPFAEILAEVSQARLTGSLRVSAKDRKSIVYFKGGRVAFAVSNSRSSRLFEILLRQKKIEPGLLAKIPKFSSDLEFAAFLNEQEIFSKDEIDRFFVEQIEGILVDVLSWPAGDWVFSPLARLKDGLKFNVGTEGLLLDYARCMPINSVLGRFRSLQESFSRAANGNSELHLHPNEAHVLSRFTERPTTARDLIAMNKLPESPTVHTLYALWLSGLLVRTDWNPAFSDVKIAAIQAARLELKKEAIEIGTAKTLSDHKETSKEKEAPVPVIQPLPVKEISLDEYLEHIEMADTYYDILGIEATAEIGELKQAYFGLAKMFHPDRYHTLGGEKLKRIQTAFTELAQAHETLKNPESREVYDYKMRKELAEREKRRAAGTLGNRNLQIEQATEYFERGFSLLMDEDYEAAITFLARAVHFAPKNARYHAYYGKALSSDESKRYKAEAEMQAALKLDPNNPTFRILLAEFFIQNNLLKRAEGELKRLLGLFPSNREARDLLDSLQN